MATMSPDAEYDVRTPPQQGRLIEAAHSNRGGWVYEIDVEYLQSEKTPPEAIQGAWEVSSSGALTGRYKPNNRYRAVIECDRVLKPYMHAAVRHYPNRWISEIDPVGEHLFPDVPDKLIRGWWLVGGDGKITNRFRPSSSYNPD